MGCNSNKAFEEKGASSGVAAASVSPTLVNTQPPSKELSRLTSQESQPSSLLDEPSEKQEASAKKPSEYSSYNRGGGIPQLNSNTYSPSTTNPVIAPAYLSLPAASCGYSSGRGHSSGGGGHSGGSYSSGDSGGSSGGGDSGGGGGGCGY